MAAVTSRVTHAVAVQRRLCVLPAVVPRPRTLGSLPRLGRQQAHVQVKAASEPVEEAVDNLPHIYLWPFRAIHIPRILYTAVEWAVVVLTLGIVDAAYSGDWSRLGVITTDDELSLQTFLRFALVAHSFTSLFAGFLASRVNYHIPSALGKGFLFGTMGLMEVWQITEATEEARAEAAARAAKSSRK